ncbi:putative nucleic acid-binding Zn-ribbon protein [Acidovorax soli]|uniref:Putative nucleic acid-binding Zn-ribbon protein n=1 Tax=Acidovorax soli TaxID=592050 RepID=A0A7X0PBC9_9BURK|nr:hypothetical protein [Acidovorax soli]MBB6558775.1 putative nucleic acid-binding Zn-ribbon protein [Acidovorax soli]
MNLYLKSLRLVFRHATETIEFDRFNFFWGKIGAGKSSIARLIDYCFGGNVEWTYALQTEFIEAALSLELAGKDLTIHRQKGSTTVIATWLDGEQIEQVLLPARRPDGLVIEDSQIQVLSDLLFVLAEIPPPMVRKGRGGDRQRLERLSFRDVYHFCYLDQDYIDSDFFRLEATADVYRRSKSVDTMRLFLGYHQDRVAALEARIQGIHERRLAAKQSAHALATFLKDEGFETEIEIDSQVEELRAEADQIRAHALKTRADANALLQQGQHAVDTLREEARTLAHEIAGHEAQLDSVHKRLQETGALISELKMLTIRYSRTKSARAVLAAVDFQDCPRCNQHLPSRLPSQCAVCGQDESADTGTHEHLNEQVLQTDLRARLSELMETQAGLETQKSRTTIRLDNAIRRKASVDHGLSQRMREYDSAYLSRAVETERRATTIEQKVNTLLRLRKLPEKLASFLEDVEALSTEEAELQTQLNGLRAEAYKDLRSIEQLETLFHDCLLRAKFPGITRTHMVKIDRRSFWPEVMQDGVEDVAVTSFANMGSGGMKCIFKACFVIALHRFAATRATALPTLLIVDSAMKNLSERENQEIFKSFFGMVYELAGTELAKTQFIFIDKEFPEPPTEAQLNVKSRHMAPGDPENPPLIPYFQVPISPPVQDDASGPPSDDESPPSI